MSKAALGARNAALDAATEMRIRDVERAIARVASRTLNGAREYDSKRISATTTGWVVGTWVKLQSGSWTAAATSSSFAPDEIGVVLLVIDGTTAEIVTGGRVQLLGTSYTNNTRYYLSTSAGVATSTAPSAPNVRQPLFTAQQDGWITVDGPAGAAPRSITLSALRDVDSASVGAAGDGYLLTFDLASGLWKASAGGPASLGSRAALSVLGRAANTTGVAADIVGATTGHVLQVGASSLGWGTLGTASYADLSVTAAKLGTDVVLNTLNDVTITAVADLNFLRYDSGTAQWINADLGPMIWVAASRQFALDGGAGASAASIVGIGKPASRFFITSGTSLDFGLSGSIPLGTDISARIRSTAATDVSFYDQATSTFSGGNKVIEWGTNTTYATRYFRFQLPLQVLDDSGTGSKNLIVKSVAAQIWTIDDDITPGTWLTLLGASGDSYGRRIKLGCDLDNVGGFTLYGDRSNGTSSSRFLLGATDGTWYQSGNVTITAGSALTLVGTGSTGVYVGANTTDKIGFWGHTPVTKTTIADPSTITVSGTATGTDATMVNALKVDVTALRATLLAVTDALQACGLG